VKYVKNFEINDETLDIIALQKIVREDPRYKNVFSAVWEMSEELEKRGKNLQDFARWMKMMQQKEIAKMHAEWERASGRPMTAKQEEMVFQNSKTHLGFALINMQADFFYHIGEATKIAKIFGLSGYSPIAANKKTRGWSKGGREKAEQNKEQLEERRQRLRKIHQEMKERNPGISNHGVDLRVAKQEGVKRSTVYNARKKVAQEITVTLHPQ